MGKIKCPQGYNYNSNTMNCDPLPKIRGKINGINPYGRFIQISSTDWKWTGDGIAPTAWIDCEDGNNSFQANCNQWSDTAENQYGETSADGSMTSGTTGGHNIHTVCPDCRGKATIHPTF